MSHTNAQSLHTLQLASFTFDYRFHGYPLQMVAKRFSSADSKDRSDFGAYTLILTTGIGSNTEVWIPTIRRLYQLQSKLRTPLIGNIWAVEAPNHGDAAVLNEKVLKDQFPDYFSEGYYGYAVRTLLSSGMVDLNSKLVAIGHSAGCCAHILAVSETEPIPYRTFIMIEPALFHAKSKPIATKLAIKSFNAIKSRVDIWNTPQEAIEWMKARYPWNRWHPEVLQAVLEFGFRTLPTVEHPRETGVTSKTYKGQEAGTFWGLEDQYKSVESLSRFCNSIPVHTIYGSRKDIVPKIIQDIITDPTEGRSMASILEIPDTGHFAVHENPDKVSIKIFDILSRLDGEQSSAKL